VDQLPIALERHVDAREPRNARLRRRLVHDAASGQRRRGGQLLDGPWRLGVTRARHWIICGESRSVAQR
jgi:hypothetical protein